MNSSPRPYLKVTFFAPRKRGMRSTSSCSTCTHSTGPMPPGKSNTSGSWNAGTVYQPPSGSPARDASQITGGLRHSSMVVQIENDGAKIGSPSSPSTSRFDAVPGPELVDVGEQVVGRVSGEDVGQPRLDSDAEQRQPSRVGPPLRLRELQVAELEPAAGVRLVRVRRGQRHGHVEVVGTGGERALEHGHARTAGPRR